MRVLCLFAVCVLGAWAQDGGFEYYQGSINEKYGIQMNLTRSASEMMGTYFYVTKDTDIDLSGTIYFDPYAVGSYAEGPYEVTLGFDAMPDVLKVDLLKNAGVLPTK